MNIIYHYNNEILEDFPETYKGNPKDREVTAKAAHFLETNTIKGDAIFNLFDNEQLTLTCHLEGEDVENTANYDKIKMVIQFINGQGELT